MYSYNRRFSYIGMPPMRPFTGEAIYPHRSYAIDPPVFRNGPLAPHAPVAHISPSRVRHRPPRFPKRTLRPPVAGAHISPSLVRHRPAVFRDGPLAPHVPGAHISPSPVRHRPHTPSPGRAIRRARTPPIELRI